MCIQLAYNYFVTLKELGGLNGWQVSIECVCVCVCVGASVLVSVSGGVGGVLCDVRVLGWGGLNFEVPFNEYLKLGSSFSFYRHIFSFHFIYFHNHINTE